MTIVDNLQKISAQIQNITQQCHRDASNITLLAVSKRKPVSAIEEAYQAGQRHFGENYVQEGVSKITQLEHYKDMVWHFIGPLQSNKTKLVAEHFHWLHTIERTKIADRLQAQRPSHLAPLNVCIQVNLDDEASKAGVSLTDVPALAEHIQQLDKLCLRGLMAIPKAEQPRVQLLNSYQALAALHADLQLKYASMDTLSIGMSNDMETAIVAGSTMVRIGTAIFGART